MSQPPLVLSLCDHSGNAVRPWAEVGFECWTVDLLHPPGVGDEEEGIRKVGADVTKWCPPLNRKVEFVFAFPPCTHLAVSGARWFKGKGLDALADSLRIVAAVARICEQSGAPYLIENPVSTLATYWRKPDFQFDPCDFAGYEDGCEDLYTKKTCLWTGGGFVMPEKKRLDPTLGSKMHLLPPSEDRGSLRSVTPKGFARAVFEANYKEINNERQGPIACEPCRSDREGTGGCDLPREETQLLRMGSDES